MINIKTYIVLIVLFALIDSYYCGRHAGSRGGGYGAGHRRPYRPTSRPSTTTRRPFSTTRRSYSTTAAHYQGGTTPRYHRSSTQTPVGWNNIPPKPGSTYSTGQSPQKIKIVNKYNYHYPGYYSLPVQNPYHPGYFYTPSSYHYGVGATGGTVLGLFLGYSLAKLTTPTYSHYSFYDGYRPRYDHYEVHHYYHSKDSIPPKQEITANTIVGCVGDSVTICPVNTTSLCTSNGALMCVVSATSTVPCTDNRQVNCVSSTITCNNNTAPECKNKDSTTINIPCISTAKVSGELQTVNNTIIAANSTNVTANSTQYPITTTPLPSPSTQYPITSTPESSTKYPITATPGSVRKKREVVQNFCVTIVALPAVKNETEGEIFLKDAKSIVEKFFETAFDL